MSAASLGILAEADTTLQRADIKKIFKTTLRRLKSIPAAERNLDWVERLVTLYMITDNKLPRAASLNNRMAVARRVAGETEEFIRFSKDLEPKIAPFRITNHGKVLPFRDRDSSPILAELGKLFEVLDRNGYAAFINSGTLLGAVRDGGFLPHDDDIDLAVRIDGATPQDRIASLRKLGRAIVASGISSSPVKLSGSGPIVKLEIGDNIGVDLFALWVKNDQVHIWPHTYGELSAEQVFPLGTQDLHGIPMPVPADPEAMLAVNYGPDWRSPNSLFRFNWADARERFEQDITAYTKQRNTLRNRLARMIGRADRP